MIDNVRKDHKKLIDDLSREKTDLKEKLRIAEDVIDSLRRHAAEGRSNGSIEHDKEMFAMQRQIDSLLQELALRSTDKQMSNLDIFKRRGQDETTMQMSSIETQTSSNTVELLEQTNAANVFTHHEREKLIEDIEQYKLIIKELQYTASSSSSHGQKNMKINLDTIVEESGRVQELLGQVEMYQEQVQKLNKQLAIVTKSTVSKEQENFVDISRKVFSFTWEGQVRTPSLQKKLTQIAKCLEDTREVLSLLRTKTWAATEEKYEESLRDATRDRGSDEIEASIVRVSVMCDWDIASTNIPLPLSSIDSFKPVAQSTLSPPADEVIKKGKILNASVYPEASKKTESSKSGSTNSSGRNILSSAKTTSPIAFANRPRSASPRHILSESGSSLASPRPSAPFQPRVKPSSTFFGGRPMVSSRRSSSPRRESPTLQESRWSESSNGYESYYSKPRGVKFTQALRFGGPMVHQPSDGDETVGLELFQGGDLF